MLLQEVWGYRGGIVSRAVDTAIRRLRRKMGDGVDGPAQILTLRGVGYRFEALPPALAPAPALPPRRLWGRDALLERLSAVLEEDRVVLTGPPGVGKTALAAAYAARLRAPLSWIDAHAPDALARIASARQTSPDLVVLDGADDLGDAAWDEIDRLHLRPSRLLITARSRPPRADRGGVVLPVPPIEADVAARMLFARAPLADPAALEPAVVRRLVAAVGAIPLGIALVAAELATLPADALADRLEHASPDPLHRQILAAIDGLAPPLRRTLTNLAVFAGPFALLVACRILGVEEREVLDLVGASLVQAAPDRERHLHLLAPIAVVARERFATSPDRAAVIAAHRAYWVARAREAWDGTIAPMDPIGEDWPEGAAAALAGPLDDDGVVLACWVMEGVRDAIDPIAALIETPPAATDPRLVARFVRSRARMRIRQGNPAAFYEDLADAVRLASAHGLRDEALEASAALVSAQAEVDHASLSVRERIAELLAEAASLAVGGPAWISVHLAAAKIAWRQRDREAAAKWFEVVLEPMAACGDLRGEAMVRFHLALAADDRIDATRLIEDAVQLARLSGHEPMSLRMHVRRMQWMAGEAGREAEVDDEIRRLLDRVRRIAHPSLQAEVLQLRGLVRLNRGHHQGATADLRAARGQLVRLNHPWAALVTEGLVGVVEHDRGRWIEAAGRYQAAAAEAVEIGDLKVAGRWRSHLARALWDRGDRDAAERTLLAAIDLFPLPEEEVGLMRFIATPGAPPAIDRARKELWWWPALARIIDRGRPV